MENVEQPARKGTVFSRASLAGIASSRGAAAAAFRGQVLLGLGSPWLRVELQAASRAEDGVTVTVSELGVSAELTRCVLAPSPLLAPLWLGQSQRVSGCIRPRRHSLR